MNGMVTGSGAADAVAIVGIGMIAPGVSGPQDFWRILHSPANALGEPEHFDVTHWYDPDRSAPDKSYVRISGFLHEFTPHPRLADEQSRGYWDRADPTTLLLRHSLLQALDTVTVRAADRCGAYVGTPPTGLGVEDAILLATAEDALGRGRHEHLRARYRHAPGHSADALPHRLLRTACRDLLPESSDLLVIDTACSSSLYAIDFGAKALLAGERDVVCCGGAIVGTRRDLVLFAKLHGYSDNGELRAFDIDASGTLFSDSAAVVTLKMLDRAVADSDDILAVLGGFGGAADGQGSLLATSPVGQRLALERAHAVDPATADAVEWIVAHGTGTPLGDDVELETLTAAPGSGRLWCTSNKPLIGHGAWSAGAINAIHAVLAMRHSEIPAEQYFATLRPGVPTDRVTVPTESVPWPVRIGRPRIAGLCAYGLGGTNAHLLLQAPDPGVTAPRHAATNAPASQEDPMVLVGTAVHFPGDPGRAEIERWLRGEGPAPAASFGDQYPLPPFRELRMPPVSARSIDRTHLMALAVVRNFVAEHGELWDDMRERTGVITGHTGPTRCSADYTIRAGADDLQAALRHTPEVTPAQLLRLDNALAALRARLPEANDANMTGQLTNIISATVVNRYRLHGAALNVDCGRSSAQAALHAAERYLRSGELDFALVIGISGHATELMATLSDVVDEELGEAAVLLAVTRRSVADRNNWPVRAIVRTDAGHAGHHIGITGAPGRCYFGADGALAALRATTGGRTGVTVLGNRDHGPRVEIDPAPAATETATPIPQRSVVVLRRADPRPSGAAVPAIKPGTLILTHHAHLALQLEAHARDADSWVLCTDRRVAASARITVANGTGQAAVVDAALMGADLEHVLVVASARLETVAWPAEPSPELLALHEYTLAAATALGDQPQHGSTVTALLLDSLRHSVVHPHLTLFTGFLRALACEITNPVHAVVTDADLITGLGQLGAESTLPRGRAVAYYRQGVRYLEQVCPAPVATHRSTGPLPWSGDPVIVATGGARGATAVVVTALAERTPPAGVWLLGTTPIDGLPSHLLAAADHELPRLRAEFITRERGLDPDASVAALTTRFDTLVRGREICRNLRRLEHVCGAGNVRYLVCDLRDREQVMRAAKSVYAHHQRIDLLIHGAGRIRSVATAHKSLTEFREIRDTKVAGYHHLKDAFADPAPGLWCNFGSGAALAGCAGDTDYVAANEYLCAAARYGGDEELTVAWGLWTETGMVHHLARQLRRDHGFTEITNTRGARLMLSELAIPRPLDRVPVFGLADPGGLRPTRSARCWAIRTTPGCGPGDPTRSATPTSASISSTGGRSCPR